MPDVDFDAYWKEVADCRAARRIAHGEAMRRKQRTPAKKKRSKQRRQPEKKRGFVRPDYREYIKSRAWSAKRKEAFKYHGHKCSVCGAEHGLRVHHLTYERLGRERMKDLQVLCDACHGITHEGKPSVVLTDYLSEQFRAIIG